MSDPRSLPDQSATSPATDFADFEAKYFLYHRGGPWPRATFSSAGDAYVWQQGNKGRRWAEMFFITDARGKVVTFDQNVHGHAFAIMDALARADRAASDEEQRRG